MSSDAPNSYGGLIYKALQEKLHLYTAWAIIEPTILVYCSRIPTTENTEKKDYAVQVLRELKDYLLEQKANPADINILDEEIARFEETIEIIKTTEKDDSVDDNTIEKYAALSYGIDGIISTHVAFNYSQLKRLSKGVYQKTKFLRFYISPEITISGKVVAELFEYTQDISVCKLCTTLKEEKEGSPNVGEIFYFGEKPDPRKWRIVKDITSPFYIYKFISDTRQESILLSPNKIGIGDFIIKGVTTPLIDLKNVGDSLKLATNTYHVFVHSFFDKIIKYNGMEDFRSKLSLMNITKENLFPIPFCITKDGQKKVLVYPEWFKYLIWSWLLHCKQGVTAQYPLHIFVCGDPQCLPKGTMIQTPTGDKPIEECDNYVYSINKKGEKEISRCFCKNSGIKEIYEINTDVGVIECSGEHQWFVKNKYGIRLSKTKDLKTTDTLLVYDNPELFNLQQRILNTPLKPQKILFSNLLWKIRNTDSIRQFKSSVERNRYGKSKRNVFSRTLSKIYRRNNEPKQTFSKEKNESQQDKNQRCFYSTTNIENTFIRQIQQQHIKRQKKSCLQAWQKYWTKEQQKQILRDSQTESKMGMFNVQSEQHQNGFSSSSQRQQQQKQFFRESSSSMSILPLQITSIRWTNKREEMWDLIVPDNNNFLLSCGVISHNSGKTSLINILHKLSLEVSPVFSGVSSTFKDLIPSFKTNLPRIGYIAESNRFSFLDEFLRCIARTGRNQDVIDEQVALMNDLLEHQKRRAGSGNGSVNLSMTSRILSVTNPIRGINNVTDLLEKHDRSFFSRWLIFWQPKSMIEVARTTVEEDLRIHNYDISETDFISLVDFLQGLKSEYDTARVMKVFNNAKVILNETLLDHYNARHRHHISCLMDGLVKARCLFEHDTGFRAREKDYEMLEVVWANVIKSWTDGEGLEKLPIESRHHYLPEVAEFAYKELCRAGGSMTRWETEELLCKNMSKAEYITSVVILRGAGLILEEDNLVRLWWWKNEITRRVLD